MHSINNNNNNDYVTQTVSESIEIIKFDLYNTMQIKSSQFVYTINQLHEQKTITSITTVNNNKYIDKQYTRETIW